MLDSLTDLVIIGHNGNELDQPPGMDAKYPKRPTHAKQQFPISQL